MIPVNSVADASRALTQSALPDAPVVPDQPRFVRLRSLFRRSQRPVMCEAEPTRVTRLRTVPAE